MIVHAPRSTTRSWSASSTATRAARSCSARCYNGKDKPHAKMLGDDDGGSLVVYGRKDAEIDLKKQFVITAKEHDGDQDQAAATTARATYKLEAERQDRGQGRHHGQDRGHGRGDDQERRRRSTSRRAGALKLKGATVDIEASGTVNVKGSLINIG